MSELHTLIATKQHKRTRDQIESVVQGVSRMPMLSQIAQDFGMVFLRFMVRSMSAVCMQRGEVL